MADEIKKNTKVTNEISDDELEGVSGGSWDQSDWFYASGDTPKFAVGEECYYVSGGVSRVAIIDIDYSKRGLRNKEFTYTVEFINCNKTKSSVYESQLRKM